jgi:hypothetical protein
MDCNTARLVLEFARPSASDLHPAEREALENHLDRCTECADLAHAERLFDRHVGEAMRQVEVPDRLKAHLLSRLAAERGNSYRRFIVPGIRAVAAAAAVLLLVWGIARWREEQLQPVDLDKAHNLANNISQREREEAEAYFHKHGWTVQMPADLNYAHLASYDLAEFQERQVPHLLFIKRLENGNRECAQLYLVSRNQFDLKPLARPEVSSVGYEYKIEVRYRPGDDQAWIIQYTGDSLNWLKMRGDGTGGST